jgi:peptidoglycan hydrolase-like protein with peptidoglycan-binding domain
MGIMAKQLWTMILVWVLGFPVPALSSDLGDVLNGLRALSEAEKALRKQQASPPPRQSETNNRQHAPKPKMARSQIREIQSLLSEAGYNPGPADGLMGRRTRNAIIAYERDTGRSATGQPSRQLLSDLRSTTSRTKRQTATGATRPSFDCARASTATEHAICGSTDLAELDRAVARNYAVALDGADGNTRARIKADQRAWISRRDRCGADVQCLVLSMSGRSQDLVRFASSDTETGSAQSMGGTQGATGGGSAVAGQEDILITHSGPGGVLDRKQRQREAIQKQRDFLASLVAGQVLGADAEEYFIKLQPLTEQEIREAFAEADVEISDTMEIQLSRGQIKTSRNVSQSYTMHESNQFERRRLDAAIQKKAREAILRQSRLGPADVTIVCGLEVAEYDFDAQQFPFDRETLERCFAGEPNMIGSVRGYNASVPIQSRYRPKGLPLDPSAAENLIERIGRPRFALAIPVSLSGKIVPGKHNRPALVYTAQPKGPFQVRAGQNLSDVIYTYSDSDLEDVTDTPENRELANFNRVWWLGNADEIDVVSTRAKPVKLNDIEAKALFGSETGLTWAIRTEYHQELTKGQRSLSSFFQRLGGKRELEQFSESLGIPVDNIRLVSLPVVGIRARFDRAIFVLPRPAASYPVNADLPENEDINGGRPISSLELIVTAEHILTLPDGEQRLLLAGYPKRLVVRRTSKNTRWTESREIAAVAFERAGLQDFKTVDLAWRSDLIWQGAEYVDQDPADILTQQLDISNFARSDAFAKREAAAELAKSVPERTGAKNLHWMQARVRFDAFDFDKQGWRIGSLSPDLSGETHEADKALKVTLIPDSEDRSIFLPSGAKAAKAMQDRSETFPSLDALLSFEITGVDTTYGTDFARGMTLKYKPVEIILFDSGKGRRVVNPDDVLLRHSFRDGQETASDVSQNSNAPTVPTNIEGAFSILGVKLGDDFQSAVDTFAARIEPDRKYTASTAQRQGIAKDNNVREIHDWNSYHNAVLLESTERSELLGVYHEPPELGGAVTALSRTRFFPSGKGPTWAQLRRQLIETYANIDTSALDGDTLPTTLFLSTKPKHQPGQSVDRNAISCERSMNARLKSSRGGLVRDQKARAKGYMKLFDTRAAWFDESGNLEVPRVASPLSLPRLFEGRGECPDREVMLFVLSYGPAGRILEFRQVISNPSMMAKVADARKTSMTSDVEEADFDL